LLLVHDGKVALVMRKVDDFDVACEVVEGGTVSDHKGLFLRG
jgi:pyruvate kinase